MSILSTSLSALRVSQRALETTSHNVANVSTPGYSRQRVNISARLPTQFGFGAIGNGAQVQSVQRIYDQFLGDTVNNSVSEYGRLQAFAGFSDRLGSIMSDPEAGLAANMQSFFNAANDVANDPASISAREAMLSETRVVTGRFNQMAQQLSSMDAEINSRIAQDVSDIDALASAIADVNRLIVSASSGDSNRQPNDLLDRRDTLVKELAGKIGVTTSEQEDGSLNVFYGSGQPLVVGGNPTSLITQTDPTDPSRLTIQAGEGTVTANVTESMRGGSLGGLLDFSREGIGTARNQLGRIATAFAMDVNERHRNGMDLNGKVGNDFFSIGEPEVVASRSNTGTGTLSASIADLAALGADDFVVEFDGGAYSVRNVTTGEDVPFSGTGTTGDPLSFNGIEVVVSGAPGAGDEFSLRPTANAASSLTLAIDDGRDIAAAFPVRGAANSANTGSGSVEITQIFDTSNPALLNDVSITFTDANTYQIDGAGAFAYTPGEALNVNGYEVVIDGSVQGGDEFTVGSNVGGIGDNRNLLNISTLANDGLLDGGSATLNDAVASLVSQAGINGREASRGLAAQATLLEQAEARALEVSGVNLDEEAANLLLFQQTYEAASQMIAVADQLFGTLLNAVRR